MRRIILSNLVTLQMAAERMGLEQSTLYQLRTRHGSRFPVPVWKGGKIALYDVTDLVRFYSALHDGWTVPTPDEVTA